MITTMLQGGLGNQLFQYFYGLAQARRLNTELIIDVSLLARDRQRQYNLDLFSGVTEATALGNKATVFEEQFFEPREYEVKDGDVLRGYWQSEKFFEDLGPDTVFRKLRPAQPWPQLYFPWALEKIQAAGDRATFLQIRRTDYVNNEFHGVLPIDYYKEALHLIHATTGMVPEVFVFSDEPEWCKENLVLPYAATIVGSYFQTTPTYKGREDADLYLMSLCRHAVIANSSFGWWGAWLGDFTRQPRVVVAPKQWFTASYMNTDAIVPERWIKL